MKAIVHGGSWEEKPSGLIWQKAPCRVELWRLFFLRFSQAFRRTFTIQRKRFLPNRPRLRPNSRGVNGTGGQQIVAQSRFWGLRGW